MSDKPRTFGYIRASTKKQVESPEVQKDLIRKYAVFNGLGDVTFYVDSSKSGKVPIRDREAGSEMFKALKKGDHVIVAKLDRAFRRLSDCVQILELFERMEIKLHVCNLMGGAIDLSSPIGRFIIHVLAAFAELERAFISERTKEGLAKRKRKGVAHCHHPGYGFRWEDKKVDGKLCKVAVADDDERDVMRSIAQWRLQDGAFSWHQIHNHLNYTLKLVTKDGKPWDINRIRRAFRAEMMLQLKENGGLK